MSLPCIACGSALEDALIEPESGNQPYAGTAFITQGHYGSTVFDPMDGSHLELNVCDPCLRKASERGAVFHYTPGKRRGLQWKHASRANG